MSPTTWTPQGISQPRQGQSKQKDIAPARQMTPTWQVQHALEEFFLLPVLISQLYHILLKERLVAPIVLKCIIGPLPVEYGSFKTCEYHFGSPRHSLEKCKLLRRKIQGLIDNDIIQFENIVIIDSPLTYCEGQVNVLIRIKGQGSSFTTGHPMTPYPQEVPYPSLLLNIGNPRSIISQSSHTTALDLLSIPLSMLLPILLKTKLVELMAPKIRPKNSSELHRLYDHCNYHRGMVGHSTNMCKLLKQKVQDLIKGG